MLRSRAIWGIPHTQIEEKNFWFLKLYVWIYFHRLWHISKSVKKFFDQILDIINDKILLSTPIISQKTPNKHEDFFNQGTENNVVIFLPNI